MEVSKRLDDNIALLDSLFSDCGDVVGRKFPVGRLRNVWVYISYIDSLVDRRMLEASVICQLMLEVRETPPETRDIPGDPLGMLKDGGISTADLTETSDIDDITLAMMSGDAALMIDGCEKAVIISAKGWASRGVQSAETEIVVQGAKEAFSEGLRTNTTLIRRRIRDINLKVKQMKIGRRSRTDIALMYLADVVRPEILSEAEKRLRNIDIDAVSDSGCVEQFIEDDWMSPFPQAQSTERPDKAAAAILEGRIVIIVDNSPFVLIIPATLNVFYQSPEDYNQRFQIMSLMRILRYAAGFAAVALPGLYVAVSVYHPSMIPMLLTFKMAGARQAVPFPAVVEILIMELAFELLREAGVRLPGPVSGTIGIVGGLIVGQAAVEAGLVSPIIVVIVALTGICSFAIPHVSLVAGFRLMKYFVILASAALGFFGFWISLLIILIHLASLKSCGIPYLFPFASGDANAFSDAKDSVLRFPLFAMKKRPVFANPKQARRSAKP